MRVNLVLGTLLCIITWMSLSHATHGPLQSCCLIWSSTKPRLQNIKNYTLQSGGGCPIKAIVFYTVHGKRVCADPKLQWVQIAILKVDNDNKALMEKIINEEKSTRDTTPAFASTSNNTPQMKGRHGKQGKRARRRRRMCVPEDP